MGYEVPELDTRSRQLRPWAQVTWTGIKKTFLYASAWAAIAGLVFALLNLKREDNVLEGFLFGLYAGFALYLIMAAITVLLMGIYALVLLLKSAIEYILFK